MAVERSAVPAITRAMRIIDFLAESGQSGASVSDIAAHTGIAKSTTALICGVLEDEGLTRRIEGRYRLGRRCLTLASDYLATVDRLEEFYSTVRTLPTISHCAARLAILEGTEVIYLACYEGAHPTRQAGQIGDRFPASITATGKALLSMLPDDVVQDRFRGQLLPRFTERSIQTLPELLADLAETRRRGYSVDDEETNLGSVCFAIPVASTPHRPARFAISTTLPKDVVNPESIRTIVAELQELAAVFANPLAERTF